MANGAHPLGIHAVAAPPSPSASSTFARHQHHQQQQQQQQHHQQQQQHHQLLQQHQHHQLLQHQHRLQQQQHHLQQQQQGLFLHQIAGSPGGGAAVAGMDQAMATATSEGESLDARSPDADRAESTVREGEGAGSAGGAAAASGPGGGGAAGNKALGAAAGGGGSSGGGGGAGPGATAGRGKQKDSFADWSNGAIHSLLDAFTEKNEELNGRNLRGRDWEEVTSAVNARGDGSKPVKSVLQCRNKLDNLKKRHKIEKDKMFTTGSLKTKWQWFAKMDAIVGRTAKQPRPGPSVPASLALAIAEEIPRPPSSSSPQATTGAGAGASTQTPATATAAAAAAASLSLQHQQQQQQQPTPSSSDPKKKARKKMKLTTSQLLHHDAELADVAAVISGDMEFLGTSTRPPGVDDYSRTLPQNPYAKVTEPTLQAGHLRDLPGFTRSVYEREYALIAPESQVYSPLPGWMNTLGAYLITPALGSHFSMYLAQMKGNSTSAPPLVDVERFIFVVKGELQLSTSSNEAYSMHVDWFAYLPPNMQHSLKSAYSATIVVFERRYIKDVIEQDGPKLIVGMTDKLPVLETPGEVFALRKLLPTSSTYDFNIHVMDFQPGEFLNVKEVHYFQHGLLLLEGRGIYRLGDKWHPVQAGDVIWMAPFVPQWYAALGRTRSRYLLYKDVNRDPLLHPY